MSKSVEFGTLAKIGLSAAAIELILSGCGAQTHNAPADSKTPYGAAPTSYTCGQVHRDGGTISMTITNNDTAKPVAATKLFTEIDGKPTPAPVSYERPTSTAEFLKLGQRHLAQLGVSFEVAGQDEPQFCITLYGDQQ